MLPSPPEGFRHWSVDDAGFLADAWADPAVTDWNPAPALAPGDWIAGAEARWLTRQSFDVLIVAGDDGPAGEIGLHRITCDPRRAELGIWVAAGWRRRGVGLDALGAFVRWSLWSPVDWCPGRPEAPLDQVWARTDPANRAAETLFRRAGFRSLGRGGGQTIWSATRSVLS